MTPAFDGCEFPVEAQSSHRDPFGVHVVLCQKTPEGRVHRGNCFKLSVYRQTSSGQGRGPGEFVAIAPVYAGGRTIKFHAPSLAAAGRMAAAEWNKACRR